MERLREGRDGGMQELNENKGCNIGAGRSEANETVKPNG